MPPSHPPHGKEQEQEKSSPLSLFPWQDVKAYQKRLQSFHLADTDTDTKSDSDTNAILSTGNNDYNGCLCLPVELSPIICSRFGWKRCSSRNDVVMLSCQDETNCNGVICIKYNPLLSKYSKRKLTLLYRQMLATSHKDGCSYQYDALSWLTKETANSSTSSTSITTIANKTNNNDTHPSSQRIVPPFLIHLSKEYQMIQSCFNSSNDTSLVSRLILTQSERLGQYFYCYTRNMSMNIDGNKKESSSSGDAETNSEDIQSMMIISNETVKRVVDIAQSSVPLESDQISSLSVNTILQNVLSQLTEKQDEEERISSLLEKEEANDKDKTPSLDLTEKLKKKLRDEYFREESFEDVRRKGNYKYTSRGTLLLSLFGWRVGHVSSGKEIDVDSINNSPVYVKCDLCLNCSPLPKEFLQCLSIDKNREAGTESCTVGGGRSEPPQKKRKIASTSQDDSNINDSLDQSNRQKGSTTQDTSHEGEGEEEVVAVSVNRPIPTHKFDVINSHRYYCPYVSGFHQMGDNDDKNIDEIKTGRLDSNSVPCWEIIWKQLLQSTAKRSNKSSEVGGNQQTIEEKFMSIRDKIRSSLFGYKIK